MVNNLCAVIRIYYNSTELLEFVGDPYSRFSVSKFIAYLHIASRDYSNAITTSQAKI